ncbi:MAG: hypothetical protein E3K36_04355 [Candidatus Brocadia sp.]|nr:hypothetical protein [Candidatus Brocadia sp.]
MRKLNKKQEIYKALRESGKDVKTAFDLAGYKAKPDSSSAYQLEKRIRSRNLVDPKMLELGGEVAYLTLKIAKKTLKDKGKQDLTAKEEICLKKSHDIYLEQQKRETPVINRNINLNVGASNMQELVDLSAYRDLGSGEDSTEEVISAEFTEQKPEENQSS